MALTPLKDRHQWLERELQCCLSWSVDKLFSKAMRYIVPVYHSQLSTLSIDIINHEIA